MSPPSPLTPPATSSSRSIKVEMISPSSLGSQAALATFTSLRRSTRSLTSSSTRPFNPLDLSSYASSSTPNTKSGLTTGASVPSTPGSSKRRVKDELRTPSSTKRARTKVKAEPPSTPPPAGDEPVAPESSSQKALPLLALGKPHPEPPKWREQYRLIERMRKGIVAPVDDM